MIDRKTFWFLLLLIAAMTAAALWRISLLPDWTQLPFIGRDGPTTTHGFFLFVTPLWAVFMIVIAYGSQWLVSGPNAAIATHKRSNRLVLAGTGILAALMQAFLIGRSLGYGTGIDADIPSRGGIVLVAVLIMIQGNVMPKLPWISARYSAFQLDAWQQKRSCRFAGRVSIVLGLLMIAAALLLPISTVAPFVMVLCLLYVGLIIWHAQKLKCEPSPAP